MRSYCPINKSLTCPFSMTPDYGVELTSQRLQWSYEGPFPAEVRTEVREA